MNGEKKFLTCTVSLLIISVTIAYSITFLALWPYRLWVALSLFALLVVVVIVSGLIKYQEALNEQQLRWYRVHFHTELPLDLRGMPLYLPPGAQPTTSQSPSSDDQSVPPYSYPPPQQQQRQGGR